MQILPGKVTRLEIIDETGRVLTRRPCAIDMLVQDNGRTLKVFVTGGRVEEEYAPLDAEMVTLPKSTHIT